MRPPLAWPAAVVLALGLGACQRADERASDTTSTTLTVYASLPLQGPQGAESQAVADGARLALRDAGGMVGPLVVKLAVLDDATPSAGGWDPVQTADNARTAIRDKTAIAYLGDGPSGATAISMPLLNEGGIPQVSPTSAYAGFTRSQDAGPGEPERFVPSGTRSFARTVPRSDVEARAVVAGLRAGTCRRLVLLDDGSLDGRGLLTATRRLARGAGVGVAGTVRVRPGEAPQALAASVRRGRPDCALWTGTLADTTAPVFDALHAADPQLGLFGGPGLATDAFAASLAPGTQARTELAGPPGVLEPLGPVRAFTRRYRQQVGAAPTAGSVSGYEAMQVVLAAIRRAGPKGADRAAVGRALFGLGGLRGPLGTFGVDPEGDTTRGTATRYGVRTGRLVRLRTARF